jgi:hypothetical protein
MIAGMDKIAPCPQGSYSRNELDNRGIISRGLYCVKDESLSQSEILVEVKANVAEITKLGVVAGQFREMAADLAADKTV